MVLVAQSDFTSDLQHCRDRFLVQSLPILPGQQPDSNAFKREKFKVQDHKLRVSIVSPSIAPRPALLPLSTWFRARTLSAGGSCGGLRWC